MSSGVLRYLQVSPSVLRCPPVSSGVLRCLQVSSGVLGFLQVSSDVSRFLQVSSGRTETSRRAEGQKLLGLDVESDSSESPQLILTYSQSLQWNHFHLVLCCFYPVIFLTAVNHFVLLF